MPTLKLRLSVPNIPFLFNPDLIGGGLLSVDTTFITIDSDIFRADNHYNLMRSAEMLTNGIFLTDSDWSKTNATISGGTANFNISSGAYAKLEQSVTYVEGRTYRLFAVVNGTAGKRMRFRDDTGNSGGLTSSNAQITMDGTDQFVEFFFTATSASDTVAIERQDNASDDNYSFTVDNVSLTEDQTFGPELLLNSNFATDSDYTKGTGWSIVDGKAVGVSGSTSKLEQSISGLSGKRCRVKFTLSDYGGSGAVIVDFGSTTSANINTNGVHEVFGTYDINKFELLKGSAFSGKIDDLSVVEDRSLNIL